MVKGGFWSCVYVLCGVQVPSIESCSVCGFLWGLDGDGALVVWAAAQGKCTYALWELSATIQKCQAQTRVDFTLKQAILNSHSPETHVFHCTR